MTTTAQEVASFCVLHFAAHADPIAADFPILGPNKLSDLSKGGVAFCGQAAATTPEAQTVPEGALLIAPRDHRVSSGTVLRVDNPRFVFAKVAARFFVPPATPGVHPTAIVHPLALVHPTATVGAFCFVGPRCEIGERTVIHHHVVLAKDVLIGTDCVVMSHSVLGEDGFGIEYDQDGNQFRLPHLGGVRIGNHVEIGNFNAVVAGTIRATTIGDYTMFDNMVHVAHNVQIGRNCQFRACAEISGSVKIGNEVIIAPNASITDGVSIGDGAFIGIGAAVTRSVAARTVAAGVPAKPIRKITDE